MFINASYSIWNPTGLRHEFSNVKNMSIYKKTSCDHIYNPDSKECWDAKENKHYVIITFLHKLKDNIQRQYI